MSNHERNGPGSVLQHSTGAGSDLSVRREDAHSVYRNPIDYQRHRLRNRYGLSDRQSALIATLHFGEVKQ